MKILKINGIIWICIGFLLIFIALFVPTSKEEKTIEKISCVNGTVWKRQASTTGEVIVQQFAPNGKPIPCMEIK